MTRVAPSLLRVALTGGIATGKSYCLARFAALGAATIDADVLARAAVEPGSAGLAAVAARFGRDVLMPDGQLDRARLAGIVFADERARRDLEDIIHPFVYADIARWITSLASDAGTPAPAVAIADVPLLFESGHAADFDRVIVVACPRDQQVARLMARDGLDRAEAERRLASQWPIDRKRDRADFVIDTSQRFEDTDRQVRDVAQRLGLPRT